MLSKAQQDDLVMGLVEQVLARPVEEREAFLNKACADDTELFNEVWRYVDAEERMNGFLLEPLYPATSLEHSIKPGEILDGRFRIVREIARGGMGIVYEAVDQKLDRRIALKCAKTGFDKRLLPEVRHASEISHPNVCKIFEIHTASTTEGEIDFITMEFLEGETLSERLRRGIPSEEARTIAQQLCAGLAEAHRNNVVHGDLKSNNVILTTSAEGSVRAVITDFGLARRTESSQRTRQSGVAGGTPAYMAPELWKGEKASPASDVFALGVILHELASGQLPFGSETTVLEGERPRRVPRVSGPFRKWDAIVTRCLNPDPRKRFRTSAEVGIALAPSRASRWVAVAAAAILLAIVSSVVTYQRATTPAEVLRLAVLPFDGDEESKALRDGLLLDTEERLRGVKPSRLRLTVVPLTDAIQNRVDQPARARTMLGATHSLSGEVHKRNGRVRVRAYLSDTRSLAHLAEWQTEYGEDDLRDMPVALAGLVTGALRLPPLIAMPSVKAAAYADYVAGVSLARRDSNLDLAIPLLERAVQADPDSPLTHASLADAEFSKYRVTREPEWKRRAFESLKKAEQRNPDVALVRFVSGTINDDEGQYEQAQADFQRAIELDPNNGDAWRRLGNAYNDDNQPNRALAAYMKAIEVQPDYYRNYQFLGEFYFTRGDYDGAINQYRRMVELAPDLPAAHYQLATPYLNTGRYTEAEQELNISIGLRETAVAVEGLGVSRMYQDQNREAIPYFQRALEIGPKTSLRYLNLGTVFRRAGFARESRDAYQNGLDLAEANLATNPRDAYEKSCLAYLCARLGDRRRAEAEIAQALQLARGANNVRWMAALTYEALGVHDRTLAAVEDAPKSLLDRLNRFPDLADLRALPRFQELIASHGTR